MPQSKKNRNLFLLSGIAAPTRRLWLDGAARDARYMGEWQKLTAEAAILEKLVQVHRLQHRRTGYFARVLDVRRGVRAVLGKGAHLAQVEQALHAIRAAWKDLQSLLIQTYFMPYAIVHLALLSRLATLLSAHHAHLRSTLRLAPAQTQPALLALCASTSSETALDRIFGGVAAASAPHGLPTPQRKSASQDGTAGASLASQPVESSLPVASRDSEDLGEPVPGEGDEDCGQPMPAEALEPAEAGAEVGAELMWSVDARPGIVGVDGVVAAGRPVVAAPAPAPASAAAAAPAAFVLPAACARLADGSAAGEAGAVSEADGPDVDPTPCVDLQAGQAAAAAAAAAGGGVRALSSSPFMNVWHL